MSSKIEYPGVILQINEHGMRVKILQETACAGCHAQSMCNLSDVKEKILEIPDHKGNFRVGEEVLVTGSALLGLKAVMLAFFLPMLIMLVLLFAGIRLFESEITGAGMAVSALIIYYLVLFFLKNKLKRKFVFNLNKI
ncbi:MAG: SoxR reducing system RseC family protein [Dysgonamonadaceae bacterium]|jgi:sigma-E factor negative regulatory protein RseC|nr:SoxR reducing system RseC family protein [Dysgonamonadaceae bacterium]